MKDREGLITTISSNTPSSLSSYPTKSLWNTPEFYFYYIYVGCSLYYWLHRAFRFSRSDTDFYTTYASTLSEGWLFGLKLDDTDVQYRGFRKNLPKLGLVLMMYVGAGYLWMYGNRGKGRVESRFWYDLVCSMIFLIVSYGSSCIWIITIVLFNYLIGKTSRSSIFNPILTWMFAILVLISNEYYQGYPFSRCFPLWSFLDNYRGLTHDPSWHVFFPITLLRAISFNIDYHWSFRRREYQETLEKHRKTCLECDEVRQILCEKMLIEQPRNFEEYSLLHYLVYLFYIPLYFAGPIMNFNGFMGQYEKRILSLDRDWKSTSMYALRLANALLIMEVMNHFFYTNAISKQHLWSHLSPIELMVLSYLLLKHVWLKLLIIWRFFRFFALMDGLKPPENMDRCMSNHYSGLEFWKSWHRSFNRWLVRYLYIPLGGAKWRAINMWIVFTFVALWHNATLNLLIWGWLICLIALPEIVCRFLFLRPPFTDWLYFRHLCALAAAFNIFAMMAANLTGFAFGIEGLSYFLNRLTTSTSGLACFVIAMLGFFSAAQIMFELRKTRLFHKIL
jgi:protein-cysteine N-palmitoyltransferase HHAT